MKSTTGGITTSVVRRHLGRRLRAMRMAAGKTSNDVAEARIAARNKLWKIERGRMAVKPGDVLALTRLYGADTRTVDELMRLADASSTPNFQEDHDGWAITEWVGLYGNLEADASMLQHYSPELLHGLLQTEAYARAVLATDPTLSAEIVEQRVRFRMRRQRAFFDRPKPGRMRLVMPAGILRMPVGSSIARDEQIAHLRAVDDEDQVSVRILPATNGLHTGMNGPFTILDFDDPDDPSLVYLESLVGSRYIERVPQVGVYRNAFRRIWEQASPLEEHL